MTQLVPVDVSPEYYEFDVKRGATFRRKITLFTDSTKKVRRNLAGITIKVYVGEEFTTLVRGAGLTVTDAQGEVVVELTPSQTEKAPSDQLDWHMKLSQESPEEAVYPAEGLFLFTNP